MNDVIDEKKDSFIHIRCCGPETNGHIADYKQKITRLPRNFHEHDLFFDHCRAIALCMPKWMSKKCKESPVDEELFVYQQNREGLLFEIFETGKESCSAYFPEMEYFIHPYSPKSWGWYVKQGLESGTLKRIEGLKHTYWYCGDHLKKSTEQKAQEEKL